MAEPKLESLPVELKVLILFRLPDTDTLRSLVFASPGYHQAYLGVREELLESLLTQQYTGFLDLAEALTAIRSRNLHFTTQRERAISLLDTWRRRNETRELSQTLSKSIHKPDGLEEIINLLHFHKMLNFFLEDFSIHAPRPLWIQAAQWENEYLPLHLTVLEKQRFLRALCRFQVLRNIFGDADFRHDHDLKVWQIGEAGRSIDGSSESPTGTIVKEAYKLFYGTILPWEHDEIGSVFGYLISKIAAICEEIADDLRQLTKRTSCDEFCDIPVEQQPPLGAIDRVSDLAHFDRHFPGLAGLGPEFLYRILHMDCLSRRDIIIVNTRPYWPGPFIGSQVELSPSERFPFLEPADRYMTQNFEELWSDLPALEQPTMGWKRAWLLPHDEEDILEDSLDFNRDDEKDWEWSYALWDEKRLQEWEALLLAKSSPLGEVPGST